MARTLLKVLVEKRHLRDATLFGIEYDRAAARIDRSLVGTGPSHEQLERWLAGRVKTKPRAHHCVVLEAMFGHTLAELFAPPQENSGTVTATSAPPRGRVEEAATNRRDALKAGTGAMAGVMLHQVLAEPDQMHSALDLGSVSEERLSYLEHAADALGHRFFSAPGASLVPETTAAFASVRTLVREPQRTADRVRLIRTGAKLAMVMGQILFDEQQFGLASQWDLVAYRASVDIGDQMMVDVSLAKQANIPAYTNDPRGVLALVDPRLGQSKLTPTSGVAGLWAAKARAHGMLGEEIAFRHAVNRSRAALDSSPSSDDTPTVFTFPRRRLGFYEATGYVRLGQTRPAIEAADRAITLYAPGIYSSELTMILLDKASACARSGEIEEACRIAIDAMTDDHANTSSVVMIRAAEFDRLVSSSTQARGWRDIYHQIRSTPELPRSV